MRVVRRIWLLGLPCACLLALAGVPPGRAGTAAPLIEDVRREQGPFDLGTDRFTLVLDVKRLGGHGGAPDFRETLARMEI